MNPKFLNLMAFAAMIGIGSLGSYVDIDTPHRPRKTGGKLLTPPPDNPEHERVVRERRNKRQTGTSLLDKARRAKGRH